MYYVQSQPFILEFWHMRPCKVHVVLSGYSKVILSFLPLKDNSNMLANWYTYDVGDVAKDVNRYWKKQRKQKMGFQVLEKILNIKMLLLWICGNFATRGASIWYASWAHTQSPIFISLKIQKIFDIISVRPQWSLRKKILSTTVALRKGIKKKCSNTFKYLSQEGWA